MNLSTERDPTAFPNVLLFPLPFFPLYPTDASLDVACDPCPRPATGYLCEVFGSVFFQAVVGGGSSQSH